MPEFEGIKKRGSKINMNLFKIKSFVKSSMYKLTWWCMLQVGCQSQNSLGGTFNSFHGTNKGKSMECHWKSTINMLQMLGGIMLKMYTLHIISHFCWQEGNASMLAHMEDLLHSRYFYEVSCVLKISALEIVNCDFLIGWNGWEVPTINGTFLYSLLLIMAVLLWVQKICWWMLVGMGQDCNMPNNKYLEIWLLKVGYIDLFKKERLFWLMMPDLCHSVVNRYATKLYR